MTPMQLRAQVAQLSLAPTEDAVARSILYAALFDYPLTLSELRRTLIRSRQTASEILATVRNSPSLREIVDSKDGYFFPAGCAHLVETRRHRAVRSRSFLASHRLILRLLTACPFVRMVALSGSVAHMNLESGGDLDVFIVTRGAHVWLVAVTVVLLAKLLGRRRTLCANFIISDGDLRFAQADLFTANQIIGLVPLTGADTFQRLLDANPFVADYYPNFHAADRVTAHVRRRPRLPWLKPFVESLLWMPAALAERVCRRAYRSYLQRRAARWTSPEQVHLGDTVLKLHTRSHRSDVISRFEETLRNALP
ncbi:MAG: hypothetical protein U0Q11_23050 [Vicinamibacterales bacterium]